MPAIPAIVAGLDLNGLGVVRSLAAGGVPVIALDTDFDKPEGRTRLARKIAVPSLDGQAFLEALDALAADLPERPFLMFTQERSVETVAERENDLAARFRFAFPAAETARELLHKASMQAAAERLGMPVPRSLAVASGDSLAAADLSFPCILKPATKDDAYGAHFKKAYRVESLAEAEARFQAMRDVYADFILQEWIEGEDDDIWFCLQYRDGEARRVASFVGRKIRSWPPGVGGTASCSAGGEGADEVEALTDRFFEALSMRGFASVEYKRDRRDGRFVMVEPTIGRTDYQQEVATVNGVNLPLAAYCHECGLPAPPTLAPAPPRRWLDPFAERYAAETDRRPLPAWCRDHPAVDAYWRLRDPGPWLALNARRLRRGLVARLSRRLL